MIELYYDDNVDRMNILYNEGKRAKLVYSDFIYDDLDFTWAYISHKLLDSNGSLFAQTDYRSVAELKLELDDIFIEGGLVNWIVWPYDWGGRPKDAYGRKHDDILWYSKTKDYIFYPERVQITKKMVGAGFNPSGRTTKTPTDVWDDIGNFHTMSSERIKYKGHNVHWQKPERLIERIILAHTDEGDLVIDPFLGTGTTAVVCKKLKRNFIGIENNEEIFKLARERIIDLGI